MAHQAATPTNSPCLPINPMPWTSVRTSFRQAPSALSGLEHDSREVGGRQLAGSDHSPGGNASAELGIRDCLRDTGAARLRSRSNDGATLRVSAEAPVCAMDSN